MEGVGVEGGSGPIEPNRCTDLYFFGRSIPCSEDGEKECISDIERPIVT